MKYKITSQRLSESLYRVNMKPQELANASGVSKSSISQYINGSHKPSELTAKRLAKILGVNPLWLMGYNILDKSLDFSKDSEYISKFLSLNSDHKYQVCGYIDRLLEEESENGENIKFYRKQRNMTLKELGCKVGITESTMQKYETGQIKRIDVEAVQKISSALDISPEFIVKWDEEKAAMSPIPSLYSAIREQRIKINMSQEELARRTGYTSRSSIAKIEKGEVDLSLSKIVLFAKVLGMEVYDLINPEKEDYEEEKQCRIFSKNLKYYIHKSGKQQKEIAEELGFKPTTFNTWCVGKIMPKMKKIQVIADYFGISKFDLIEEKESRDKNFMQVCSEIFSNDKRFQKIIMDYYSFSKEEKEVFCDFYEKFILK